MGGGGGACDDEPSPCCVRLFLVDLVMYWRLSLPCSTAGMAVFVLKMEIDEWQASSGGAHTRVYLHPTEYLTEQGMMEQGPR
ncbi:hypothetical protein RIF29_25827 [Crotalaria pallida]|uniref:Uncharacterized protein n=1 Tax=Crotalaria pallida TaxID=3830 RepID=A0AAN9I016_CROPI